jgi:hypothetical protein
MDIWNATKSQIKQAAKKYFDKYPVEVLKQSGLYAYVYFADGTSETVYQWMVN